MVQSFAVQFVNPVEVEFYNPSQFDNRLILSYGGGWKNRQLDNPIVFVNPKNSAQLVMLFDGMTDDYVDAIGKATASVSDPYTWTEYGSNPIIGGGGDSTTFRRVNSCLYDEDNDEYIIYASGIVAPVGNIYRYTCPAGDGYSGLIAANVVAQGVVLAPSGDETGVTDGSVFRVSPILSYMYYSYLTASVAVPNFRVASSDDDGLTWTKLGDLFPGTPGNRYETHQVYKTGSVYWMVFECGLYDGKRWTCGLAASTDPVTGWEQIGLLQIDQTRWDGYDSAEIYNVATPFFCEISGTWYLFYVATAGPVPDYNTSHWAMWQVNCQASVTILTEDIAIPEMMDDVISLLGATAYWDPAQFTGVSDGNPIATGQDSSDTLTPYDLSQADSGKQALYIANVLNGNPVMRFDGTNDFYSYDDAEVEDFSVYVVIKQTGDNNLLGGTSTGGTSPQIRVGELGDNKLSTFDGFNNPLSDTLAVAQDQWSLIEFVRSSDTVGFFQDGVSYGSGDMTATMTFNRMSGAINGTVLLISGDVAFVGFYGMAHDEADRQIVEDAITARFGI